MKQKENNTVRAGRVLPVEIEDDDTISRLVDIPAGEYEGVMVNNSWPEKGLISGDIILFQRDRYPNPGDIVLLESDNSANIGLMGGPGYLETPYGSRPLDADENITSVGLALIRRLQEDDLSGLDDSVAELDKS
jgi:hypothetical protein